jgi:type IV pilus assembly protein PilV
MLFENRQNMHRFPRKMIAEHRHNIKKQAGILLIEVMIAVLIFSFGLLGLAGLQATSTQSAVNAEERIRATLLANDMVAMLWVRQSLANATDIATWKAKVASAESGLPNATGNVDVVGAVATITITWKSPSKKATDGSSKYETSIAMGN